MLRRRVVCACGAGALSHPARFLFNPFSGAGSADKGSAAKNTTSEGGNADTAGGFPGFPPGMDAQKLRTMQELFASQSPEKQQQLMQQAMDFQKTMSKVPGFGKFAQKNAAMMEHMMKLKDQMPKESGGTFGGSTAGNTAHNRRDLFQAAPRASSSSTGASASPGSGPTLDDLRKVNLGPEIESLFTELRTMRAKKNEYRDKFFTANTALEQVKAELDALRTKEASVRQKLSKAEKDVMLLTSENMELRDSEKRVKELTSSNKELASKLHTLETQKGRGTAEGSPAYTALQQQLRVKEEALRSLQRKVDRMRRRDPLLQFSLACSDVARFCDEAHDPAKESADDSFARVQSAYQEKQEAAWREVAQQGGAAAKAFIAVARRYVLSKVPLAHLDAVVTVEGDIKAAVAAFEALGLMVETSPAAPERLVVSAPGEAGPCTSAPGPYGYALAWRVVTGAADNHTSTSAGTVPTFSPGFVLTQVSPYVSTTLVANSKRTEVVFETARASGPGGQATNVSETQVYAKLAIDGQPTFTAEAQDSRSALQNKESAVAKLHGERRQAFNDSLTKQRVEDVVDKLVGDIRHHAGGTLQIQEGLQRAVEEATAARLVPQGDAALVDFLRALGQRVGATV